MKNALIFSFLVLFAAVCYARKPFVPKPIASRRGNSMDEEIVPIIESNQGNGNSECDFCSPYMLKGEDGCYCDDVKWCEEKSCPVPESCECNQEEENDGPVEEEIVPVTESPATDNEGCDMCQPYVLVDLFDCSCDDVRSCLEINCDVPEECSEKCEE